MKTLILGTVETVLEVITPTKCATVAQFKSLSYLRITAGICTSMLITTYLLSPDDTMANIPKQVEKQRVAHVVPKPPPVTVKEQAPAKVSMSHLAKVPDDFNKVKQKPELLTGKHKLGWLSAAKESAGKVDTISKGRAGDGLDPGGISYGQHQIASKTGTMKRFINSEEAKPFETQLARYPINSRKFKRAWKKLSKRQDFIQAQYNFVKRTHYNSPIKYAKARGFDTSNPLVKEAVFSMGVQSGAGGYNKKKGRWTGAKAIIRAASSSVDPRTQSVPDQVAALYRVRWAFTRGSTVSDRHYKIRKKRYQSEYKMLMKWGKQSRTKLALK